MIDTYDSCTCINIGKATFLSNHIHTPKPKCSMYEHMALETTPMYSRQICHTWSVWEWVGSFIPAKSQSLSSFSSLSCSSGCCSTTFKLAHVLLDRFLTCPQWPNNKLFKRIQHLHTWCPTRTPKRNHKNL